MFLHFTGLRLILLTVLEVYLPVKDASRNVEKNLVANILYLYPVKIVLRME